MKLDRQRKVPRGSSRFSAGIHGEVHYRGTSYPCTVQNLSRTGVLLIGGIPWPSQPEVEFTLKAPVGNLELRLKGQTARIEDDPSGQGTRIALEFQDLDSEQKKTLESLISRVLEGQAPVPLEDLPPGATPKEIRVALEKIPLARRISLAARANPREREYLRHDTHPQVLEALARNPNLLQAEVWELAGVRHLLPSTLELLANDPRWEQDDELKILLATHPRVPLPLADGLLSALKPEALRKALQKPGLNDLMRSKLLRRIARGTSRK